MVSQAPRDFSLGGWKSRFKFDVFAKCLPATEKEKVGGGGGVERRVKERKNGREGAARKRLACLTSRHASGVACNKL